MKTIKRRKPLSEPAKHLPRSGNDEPRPANPVFARLYAAKRKQEPESAGRRKVKTAEARTHMENFNSPKSTTAKREYPRAGLPDGYVTEVEVVKPGTRTGRLADRATDTSLHREG
jgi:hypothetical protein